MEMISLHALVLSLTTMSLLKTTTTATSARISSHDSAVRQYVVVADGDRKNVFQISLDTGDVIALLPTHVQQHAAPLAVAFDSHNKTVYWTDTNVAMISRYDLLDEGSGNARRLYLDDDANSTLDCLALDSSSGRLYYCHVMHARGAISRLKTSGAQNEEIISRPGMKPRAIVLDTDRRLIYWTDWGDTPAISRANLVDGSDIQTIVTRDLMWPNGLAIDFEEQRMFWTDARLTKIESSRLDGSDRRVLMHAQHSHFFAIAASAEFLFYTDWSQPSVKRLARESQGTAAETSSSLTGPRFSLLNGLIYYRVTNNTPPIPVAPYPASSVQDVLTTTNKIITEPQTDALKTADYAALSDQKPDSSVNMLLAVIVIGVVVIAVAIATGLAVTKHKRCLRRSSAVESVSLQPSENAYNSLPPYSAMPRNERSTLQDDPPIYDVVFDNSVNAARARAGIPAPALAPADEGCYLTAPSEEDGYLKARPAPDDDYYSVCT